MSLHEINEWRDILNNLVLYTSPSPRVKQTAEIIKKELFNDLEVKDFWWLAYQQWEGKDGVMTKFATLVEKYCKSNRVSMDEFLQGFSLGKYDDELDIKEYIRPFMRKAQRYLEKVEKEDKSYKIIYFRHWDKTRKENTHHFNQELSDRWKEQAKDLGERIKSNIDNTNKNTEIQLMGIHELPNEILCSTLIWYDNLPDSWKKPLNLAEEIEYFFTKDEDWNAVLKITRAWETIIVDKENINLKFV